LDEEERLQKKLDFDCPSACVAALCLREDPEPVAAVLKIASDHALVSEIKAGYKTDKYCQRLLQNLDSVPGVSCENDLLFVGGRLVIPSSPNLRERIFQAAHDSLGHFGFEKGYTAIRDSYYWPHMRKELEEAYIPSCPDCQRNKASTKKSPGPLHPLPIPEKRGDSVAMDFVGPLPEENGFDGILTLTDRLGCDIRCIPVRMDYTAADVAEVFFNEWYCNNGLPLEIISDRDKLFTSAFWTALHKLTGVKLKLSSSYHPETDGASERTNKTVIQCLRYHVDRNQKGWTQALPRIRFAIMNTINASTEFSPFQLLMGRSPRVIPPLLEGDEDRLMDGSVTDEAKGALKLIRKLETDVLEAQDNLILAKSSQANQANKKRSPDPLYNVGDRVLLSTLHRRKAYLRKGRFRVAKFMPRWDGPYEIIDTNHKASTYTLDLPNNPGAFPTFHVSQLRAYHTNDENLFPDRDLPRPGPVITEEGEEQWEIEEIVDERKRGRGRQYLVKWRGWGDEDMRWLPARELDETEALDRWIEGNGKDRS
jgi:hypothetical protein